MSVWQAVCREASFRENAGPGEPGPGPGGGITEAEARKIADEEAKEAIEAHIANHPGGGEQGPVGPAGPAGPAGADGTDGTDGHTPNLTSGDGAPAAAAEDGDLYLDNSTGDLYTQQGGQWIKTGNIKGPAGDAGDVQPQIDAAIAEALKTTVIEEGVVAETGWTVTAQEFTVTAGVGTASVHLDRTGAQIDIPADGNLTPDLKICTVPEAWRPKKTFYVAISAGFGSGTARVPADGAVQIVTWGAQQPIETGQTVRFNYTICGVVLPAAAVRSSRKS